MSLNLHATCGDTTIELWQTPTYITEMCLITSKGTFLDEVTGKKAIRALRIYLVWVASVGNGSYKSEEEANRFSVCNREHKRYIESFINSGKEITVWEM